MSEEIDTYELERIAAGHGVTPHSCVIEHDDDFGRAIARHVNDSQGSLLVMATTAKAPIGHHALGTVTESVLTHVAAPVLLIGPRVLGRFRARQTHLGRLRGRDRRGRCRPAGDRRLGGNLRRRTAVGRRGHQRPRYPRSQRCGAARRQYADSARRERRRRSWRVLHGADPARSLEDFALTVEDAVLVAVERSLDRLGPHLHSATRRLVHASTRPVLVVAARRDLAAEVNPMTLHGADR